MRVFDFLVVNVNMLQLKQETSDYIKRIYIKVYGILLVNVNMLQLMQEVSDYIERINMKE